VSFPQLPTSIRFRLGAVAAIAVLLAIVIAPTSIVAASAADSDQSISTLASSESIAEPTGNETEPGRASEVATEALAFTGPEVDHTALAGSIMTAVGMLLVAAAKRFTEPDWY
jgi:hypothetical protein